ncbi:recombination-associated protein RdgC [Escherichia coli]
MKLALDWQNRIKFTLDHNFSLTSVKFCGIIVSSNSDIQIVKMLRSHWTADFFRAGPSEISCLVDALVNALGGRLSSQLRDALFALELKPRNIAWNRWYVLRGLLKSSLFHLPSDTAGPYRDLGDMTKLAKVGREIESHALVGYALSGIQYRGLTWWAL